LIELTVAISGSWIAGTVYARGLQEAPDHVKVRSMEYRAASRAWHGFLGFRVHLGARKRPLAEIHEQGNTASKRIPVTRQACRENTYLL